jgi:hypothetical protein
VIVERRFFSYQRVHIRNRNEDFYRLIRQRLGNRKLIQITRIIIID